MHYLPSVQTDIGTVKQINQDSLTFKIADTKLGEIAFAVVCDGMGGLKMGEVASASVIEAFQNWFYNRLPELVKNGYETEMIKQEWQQLAKHENEKIMQYGEQRKVSLGTTLTAILFLEENYYVIHVGDCRIYEITNKLKQITKDQTFVAREVELGHLSPEEARTDKRSNILLQCIGVNPTVAPVFFTGKIEKNAMYLVCTDGFRHVISEQEIFDYCNPISNNDTFSMDEHLKYLVQLNKQRNERDNISAVMVRCGE